MQAGKLVRTKQQAPSNMQIVLCAAKLSNECYKIQYHTCKAWYRPFECEFWCSQVLAQAVGEYSEIMVRLMPWTSKVILDGGGNIGLFPPQLHHQYCRSHARLAMTGCNGILDFWLTLPKHSSLTSLQVWHQYSCLSCGPKPRCPSLSLSFESCLNHWQLLSLLVIRDTQSSSTYEAGVLIVEHAGWQTNLKE